MSEQHPTAQFQSPGGEAPPDQSPTVAAAEAGVSLSATKSEAAEPLAGAPAISQYVIAGVIAKGGMGVVYSARDLKFDREVAIKILLPGGNARRFVTEAKITARLPHPGIPPVYDLGKLDDGSHYLAMKLVRGQTLAALLAGRRRESAVAPDLPHLLQIFEQIAQAVGFAHSRGIIHRDLKPLNVMVGEFGEVQVMDWGLAKEFRGPSSVAHLGEQSQATDEGQQATDDVHHTVAGTVMGTPAYMSPEQARGEAVDQRADVFALGSILAMILTGKPAFVGTSAIETIKKAADAELRDVTGRLDACGADAELIALCKRCLSAKPEDRPENAQAVASEVAAYRAGVEARLRQAETDRARAETKAAEQTKRRKIWIGLAASLLVGLMAALALTAWALRAQQIASAERDAKDAALIAETQAKQEAERRRAEAVQNLDYARRGNELLGSVFSSLDPHANYATVAEFRGVLKTNLRQAVQELEGTAIGDPLTVAAMQSTLGGSLLGLGEGDLAITMFEKSWSTRKDLLGPDHSDTLTSMNNLSLGYQVAGKWDEAIALGEKTLQHMRTALGPDHADTLACMNNLAMGYHDLGQMDKAKQLMEETVSLMRAKFGKDHPKTLAGMNNLAECYKHTGLIDKAVLLHTETMKLRQSRLGSDHPQTLESMNNLASAHHVAGRLEASLSLLEETLPLMRSRLGSDHPHTLAAMNNLAFAYKETEKLDKALALYQESLRLKQAKLGEDHPDTLTTMNNLAECYRELGQMEKVVSLLQDTVRLRRRKLGNDHPATINSIGNLGAAYCAVRDGERAAPLLKEFITGSRKQYPANDPKFANLLTFISLDLLGCGQFAPAEEMLRECLAIRERTAPNAWTRFYTESLLGAALLGQKQYAAAEPLLLKGYEGMEQSLRASTMASGRDASRAALVTPPVLSGHVGDALDRLIQLYDETGRQDDAARYRQAKGKWWQAQLTRNSIAQLLWGWPRW